MTSLAIKGFSRVGLQGAFRRPFACLALAASVSALACSGAATPTAPPELPKTIVLRIDRVVVSPTKPETNEPWDGPDKEPISAPCHLLSLALGVASSPILGSGAEFLCQVSQAKREQQRKHEDPDLALRISAGTGTAYLSPTSRDVSNDTFKYEIAVPTAAIPADGLLVEVVDDDGTQGAQPIGAIRFYRGDFARALASSTKMLVTTDPAIRRLEVIVSEYAPIKIKPTSMAASEGLRSAETRALFAGEVVELAASGTYTVGKWYSAPLNPRGYPAEEARGYNFEPEPFHSAPHACGVATIGVEGTVHGVLVSPSQTFVARVPGPLRFGVNDNEPQNNNGSLAFQGATRAPTAEEWLRQGTRPAS